MGIIEAIMAMATILSVVTLLVITLGVVIEWFYKPEVAQLVEEDADAVGFTLQRELDAGNYEVVQGVFNRRTNKVDRATARKMRGQVDGELANVHKGKPLAVYS